MWTDIAPRLDGGAIYTVEGLTPGLSYYFRYMGVNSTSSVAGSMVSTTTPALPAPGPPVSFTGLTPTGVTVKAPAVPVPASSLSLQQYGGSSSTWTTVKTELAAGAETQITGLAPVTMGPPYQFRYLAVGYGSSTAGPASSVSLPTLSAPAAPTFKSVLSTSVDVVMPAMPSPSWMSSLELQQSSSSSGPWSTAASGVGGGATVPISGLTPAYKYYFRCIASGSYGSTTGTAGMVQTASGSATSAPSAPSAPTFSAVAATSLTVNPPATPMYTSQMTLKQKLASDPDSAYVTAATLTPSTMASTSISGLLPATSYTFVYIASNSYGSSTGYPASVTTLPLPPNVPQNLTATPGNAQVQLSWAATSGATGYKLKWSTSSGGPYTTINVGTVTGYTHSSVPSNTGPPAPLTNGTTYYYVLSATNSGGESANSGEVSATPNPLPSPPNAPTYTGVKPLQVDVISPPLPAGAMSLALQQNTSNASPSGSWTTIEPNMPAGSTKTVTGLSPATYYYFRVVATNATGGATPGSFSSVQTQALPTPGSPVLSDPTPISVKVKMPLLPDYMSSLTLQRSLSGGGPWTDAGSGLAGSAQITVGEPSAPLTPNTNYFFRSLAVGAYGNTISSLASISTQALPAPGVPTFGTTITPIEINVISPAVPAYSESLTLQMKLDSDPDTAYTDLATNIKAAGVTTAANGLTPGTRYTFRYVGVGNYGLANGAPVGTATQNLPAPAAPTFSSITETSLTVILPTIPTYARTMNLEQKLTSQPDTSYRILKTELPSGASVPVAGLIGSTSYTFRAVAVRDSSSTPGVAAAVTTTLVGPEKPGLPQFGEISSTGVRVLAPILPPSASTLTLQRKLHGQADSTYVTVGSGLGGGAVTDVGGLSPATTYTFRYQAVGSGGITSGGGADVTTLDANITWNAGSGLNCAGIRYAWNGAAIPGGSVGSLSAYLATDWDERVLTVDGDTTSGSYSDPCSYSWSANGGSFVGGVTTGQNVRWIAPSTPGTYTLALVVDDQGGTNKPSGESGSRDDFTLGYNDDPVSFAITVTVQ